jgi:hypothetical protein
MVQIFISRLLSLNLCVSRLTDRKARDCEPPDSKHQLSSHTLPAQIYEYVPLNIHVESKAYSINLIPDEDINVPLSITLLLRSDMGTRQR